MPQLFLLIFFFAIFYFLLLRPQQQRTKEHQKLVSELKVGDKVVTIGGIYGTVKALTEETVSLEIANNIRITVSREAIGKRKQ